MTWRRLTPPRRVTAFVAEAWHETTAADASRYRPLEPAAFPGPGG